MDEIAFSNPESINQEFELVLESLIPYFKSWEIVSEGKHRVTDIEERLKELLPSYGLKLQIHAPFTGLNIASPDKKLRKKSIEEIKATVEAGVRLGAKVITVHPGSFSPLTSPELTYELNKKALGEIADFGEERGVKIALENMGMGPTSMAHKPEEVIQMIEGTLLDFCFDVGHANFTGGWKQWVSNQELMSRLTNLHLHDNEGKEDQHLAIGEGSLNFKALLPFLKTYSGTWVIEVKSLESAILSQKRLKELMSTIL
jgi:sugar phosphate isomerase/epimerase